MADKSRRIPDPNPGKLDRDVKRVARAALAKPKSAAAKEFVARERRRALTALRVTGMDLRKLGYRRIPD
jgi:hypothetical protein